MNIRNFFKKKKQVKEVNFLQTTFKERLKASQQARKQKAFTVTVGIVYNGQVVRKFDANTKAISKAHAGRKVRDGMSLQVIDVKRKKS